MTLLSSLARQREPEQGEVAGRPSRRRRFLRSLLLLAPPAVLAAVVRVWFVLDVVDVVRVGGDANSYRLMAQYLAEGRGYIRPFAVPGAVADVPTAEFPPLFTAFLAGLYEVGIRTVTEQRLALAALGVVTVVLVGFLARAVAPRRSARLVSVVAAFLAAVHPMLIQNEAALAAESLYIPIVCVVLLLAVAVWRDPSRRWVWWVALGVAIGVATLVRAEALALVVLLGLVAAWRTRTWRRRAATGGLVAVAAVAVVAPWTIRNAIVLDEFVPVSNNLGTLLAGANCDETYSGRFEGLWLLDCFERHPWGGRTETERARRDARAGVEYAVDHRGEVPLIVTVRVLRTWGLYDLENQVEFEALEGRHLRVHRGATYASLVLLALAIAGFFYARGRSPLWPLLSTVVLVTMTAIIGYGNQRFRAAAEPALLVGAAVAIVALGQAIAGTLRKS